MKNFIFKSTDADLQKMFQYLETLQKNVLYITHQVDKTLKIVRSMEIDDNAQSQVDDFYEDAKHIPEVEKERSSTEQ